MGIDAQIVYITNGCGKVQHLEEINVDTRRKKMELNRALEILEYNKDMLTCDMSISRDPEHQDVSPDYYGKDAEDLYNAIVCVEKYIKNVIPIEWLRMWFTKKASLIGIVLMGEIESDWEKENEHKESD